MKGLTSFLGGLVISHDKQGLVQYFWANAVVGSVATVFSFLLVNKLFLYGAVSAPSINPDAAKVGQSFTFCTTP